MIEESKNNSIENPRIKKITDVKKKKKNFNHKKKKKSIFKCQSK